MHAYEKRIPDGMVTDAENHEACCQVKRRDDTSVVRTVTQVHP